MLVCMRCQIAIEPVYRAWIQEKTYMHINPLAISPVPIQYRRNNHQLLFCNKIPNASLVSGRIALSYWMKVEFEGRSEREKGKQQIADEAC